MKHLKKILLAYFILLSSLAFGNEGLWLPLLLSKLNEKEMQQMGLKITAEDIYSINKSSLKDAIVNFGGFCTGEIISSQGLVLTNHHCGLDEIQNHTTVANNYVKNGFWAQTKKDELPNPSLFVTFIVEIQDVTNDVLGNIQTGITEAERALRIEKNIATVKEKAKKESYQSILIRPFFEGNSYYLFITETYNDVRLVGAPPAAIGNFGIDTDNWMWPRHTGDFSLFRIYAGKDNKPAQYSPDNVPYVPKRSLSISLDGVSQDDFTMVFGFPGRTTEYLPRVGIQQIMEVNNPIKIRIRDEALKVMGGHMRTNEQIKIQYVSKYASVANAWKKWQGELRGMKRVNGLDKKRKLEDEFQSRVSANANLQAKYGSLLSDFNQAYADLKPYTMARDYYSEIMNRLEIFGVANTYNMLVTAYDKEGEAGYTKQLAKVKERVALFYGDYSPVVDQQMMESLLKIYVTEQSATFQSPLVIEKAKLHNGDMAKLAVTLFSKTDFDNKEKMLALLDKPAKEVVAMIRKDEAFKMYSDMVKTWQTQGLTQFNQIQERINVLQRNYMSAQMQVFTEKNFYPDANSTLRIAYGKVNGYQPADAVHFNYYTYLDGLMEKYKPGDYEFDVPEKLIDLYNRKDYGQYGVDGKLPVNFIAENHTTGGNSGSPALDAWGNLVGLNFDRVWEGTMSDMNFDPSICRNIMVDARYILFVIDKYANAGHLIQEMQLVHPKVKK